MTAEHNVKRFINQKFRGSGKFPSLQEVCSSLNYSEEQARKYMASIAEDGYVEPMGSWYKFPGHKSEPNPKDMTPKEGIPLSAEEVEQLLYELPQYEEDTQEEAVKRKRGRPFGSTKKATEPPQTVQEPLRESQKPKLTESMAIKNVRLGMGIIGIGATIISIYYSTVWLLEFLPFLLAVILSAIMIGFAVLSFEVAIIFYAKQSLKKYFVIFCFVFLWGIVSIFSIMSTVGGQYNQNVKNMQKFEDEAPGRIEWTGLQSKKNDIEESIKDKREQLSNLKSLQSGMNDLETRQKNIRAWHDINWKMKVAGKELSVALKEKEKVRIEEKELLKKYPKIMSGSGELKTIPDFYSWVAKIFNKDRDKIQFFLSLIPAIFCDVICSIGIAIFLFLKE